MRVDGQYRASVGHWTRVVNAVDHGCGPMLEHVVNWRWDGGAPPSDGESVAIGHASVLAAHSLQTPRWRAALSSRSTTSTAPHPIAGAADVGRAPYRVTAVSRGGFAVLTAVPPFALGAFSRVATAARSSSRRSAAVAALPRGSRVSKVRETQRCAGGLRGMSRDRRIELLRADRVREPPPTLRRGRSPWHTQAPWLGTCSQFSTAALLAVGRARWRAWKLRGELLAVTHSPLRTSIPHRSQGRVVCLTTLAYGEPAGRRWSEK